MQVYTLYSQATRAYSIDRFLMQHRKQVHVYTSAGVYKSSVERHAHFLWSWVRSGQGQREFFYLESTQFLTSKWVNSKDVLVPKAKGK